jgi:hypothetical protein
LTKVISYQCQVLSKQEKRGGLFGSSRFSCVALKSCQDPPWRAAKVAGLQSGQDDNRKEKAQSGPAIDYDEGDTSSGPLDGTSALDSANVPWYICTKRWAESDGGYMIEVERVQTGVRMEKRLLKVLKGFAELKDITLGDLLEGIVLHAFEGKTPFGKESLAQIGELKKIYGLTLHAGDSHKLKERGA